MIAATCPCGGTFESITGTHELDWRNTLEWLEMHRDCVNIRVIEHQVAAKKADIKAKSPEFDWRSGFTFLNNSANLDDYEFMPTGNVRCKECNYVQAKNATPVHALKCKYNEENKE